MAELSDSQKMNQQLYLLGPFLFSYNPFSFLLSEAILTIQPIESAESGAAGPMQVIHREEQKKAKSAALPFVLFSKNPSQSFYFRRFSFAQSPLFYYHSLLMLLKTKFILISR